MAYTQEVICRCGTVFHARTADINRGWGRFCSKSCKAKAQEKRTGQYKRYLARQNEGEELWDGSAGLMDGHGQWED